MMIQQGYTHYDKKKKARKPNLLYDVDFSKLNKMQWEESLIVLIYILLSC